MLTQDFALKIQACLSGSPFSLDELVLEAKALFDREGVPGFLQVIIDMVDQAVASKAIREKSFKCCESPHPNRAGKRSKRFLTSEGELILSWTATTCARCGKSDSPLKHFFGLEKNQSKTGELEKICLETIAKESYRKSTQTLNSLRPVKINHRSLHRWVMSTDADEVKVAHSDLRVIFADGSGFKKFVDHRALDRKNRLAQKLEQPVVDKSSRGEIKIMVGVTSDGKVRPLGAWASESWKVLGNAIHRANNPNKNVVPTKLADILVADGEIALGKGLGKLVNHKQRCQWHIPHDLGPLMRYQEEASEADTKFALNEVSQIFQIDIPEKNFEQVEWQDKVDLYKKIQECETAMVQLAQHLETKGYNKAGTYIRNAKDDLFTFVRYWLKTGIITPRVSSMVERLFREINRRIKKFAFNWSEKGVAIVTRILMKLICTPNEWESYWLERMRLSGNIRFTFGGITRLT